MMTWLAAPLSALAQDNVVANATLPRDLSVRGMFLNADPVVKAVMIGLVLASVVTWTVWLASGSRLAQAEPSLRAPVIECGAANYWLRVRT
jgi:biopolymer transport protein ExbB